MMDGMNPVSSPSTRGQVNQKSIQEFVNVESTEINRVNNAIEQKDAQSVSDKEVTQAIERANKNLQPYNTNLQIQFHEETQRKIVQIKNQENGETIREFPSKDFVKWEAEFTRWLGVLLDKKV